MSNVTYYKINEEAARRAKEMNSFYEYRPGNATEEYKAMPYTPFDRLVERMV